MSGTGFSGTTRTEVVAVVGDCHLVDEPGSLFRHVVHGERVFTDDDLELVAVSCSCYRLYLRVSRRVPREMWEFLVPVTIRDVQDLRTAIDAAPATYTGRWATAEAAVVRLMSDRPYLESSIRSPAVLRWSGPGKPLAFGVAPF